MNQWGETSASVATGNQVVGANQGIQITGSLPLGVTKMRYYVKASGGGNVERVYETTSLPFTMSVEATLFLPVPTRNTAFLPDVDGPTFASASLFRWLNEALQEAARLCNGIPDISGFPTTAGRGLYEANGVWNKISHAWYDGWPVAMAGKGDAFYLNRIQSSFPYGAILQHLSDRLIIELMYQPDRTAAFTTLNGAISVTADTIPLVSSANFDASLSLARIGGVSGEIVAYSNISGNSLTGVIRGLSGTVAQAWANGAVVDELNFRFAGMRHFTNPNYIPGDSAKNLPVPPAWRTPLIEYVLNRSREGEQDSRESQRKMQAFAQMITSGAFSMTKIVMGPRQVGGYGEGHETRGGLGSMGGGVIVR